MILLAPSRATIFSITACLSSTRHRRARQKRAQLRGLRVRRAKFVELLGSRIGSALRQRDIRQRIRVLEARGLQFGLPSRLFTKLLISDSCACGVSCLASSDSAPSTARFAASAFSSRRAARSAASISAFAAAAIFCASLCVAARRRVHFRGGFALCKRAQFRHFLLQIRQLRFRFAKLRVGRGFRARGVGNRRADHLRWLLRKPAAAFAEHPNHQAGDDREVDPLEDFRRAFPRPRLPPSSAACARLPREKRHKQNTYGQKMLGDFASSSLSRGSARTRRSLQDAARNFSESGPR